MHALELPDRIDDQAAVRAPARVQGAVGAVSLDFDAVANLAPIFDGRDAYLLPRARVIRARAPSGALDHCIRPSRVRQTACGVNGPWVRPLAHGAGLGQTLMARALDKPPAWGQETSFGEKATHRPSFGATADTPARQMSPEPHGQPCCVRFDLDAGGAIGPTPRPC